MDPRSAKKNTYGLEDQHSASAICGVGAWNLGACSMLRPIHADDGSNCSATSLADSWFTLAELFAGDVTMYDFYLSV